MQFIDDPSNIPAPEAPLPTVSPGAFRRPSVLAGNQGTILTADWANDVQQAIANPILAASIALVKGDATQLTAAINFLASALIATHNAISASDTVEGHIEIATSAEVLDLSDLLRAVTPGRLADAFPAVSNANGDAVTLPGGLIIQRGTAVGGVGGFVTITFPIPFSAAGSYQLSGTGEAGSATDVNIDTATARTATQAVFITTFNEGISWIAVGT